MKRIQGRIAVYQLMRSLMQSRKIKR